MYRSLRSSFPLLLLLPLLVLANPLAADAKSLRDYADDAGDYATAPLHWDRNDWESAALAAAAVAATYTQDERIRAHFATPDARVTGDPHSLRDHAPMMLLTAGTLATGLLRKDDGLRHTGLDMVEAVALSSASGFVIKHVVARDRPDATNDRDTWRTGGVSFPSGHTTAMFAAAQVFADSRPADEWSWRALAYGLGAFTAYVRVQDNMHWASDTVAGAALGIATGRFVSHRRNADDDSARVSLSLQPTRGGAMLTFAFDPFATP